MTRVLVVNAGSSSLKLSLVDSGEAIAEDVVERWDGTDPGTPLDEFLGNVGRVDVVGHRFVHGGPDRCAAVPVDDGVLADLDVVAELAPLHQHRALGAYRAVATRLPDVAHVACFDTAFHTTIPAAAATYALPAEWNARWRLRRYGFHGLSHSYASRRAAAIVGRPVEELRIVSAHLGAGASLCAVRNGTSVDTTMGLTPLAGLVMATRSGSVDPGLVLWLQRFRGIGVDELEDVLEHRSGLAGLSGTSGDLRDVTAARDRGDPAAALAVDVFIHRLASETAAMTAALGGCDLLVFTGGIGEHSAEVRRRLVESLPHLGFAIDAEANACAHGDRDLTVTGNRNVVVVTAREDLEIAAQVESVLNGRRS